MKSCVHLNKIFKACLITISITHSAIVFNIINMEKKVLTINRQLMVRIKRFLSLSLLHSKNFQMPFH